MDQGDVSASAADRLAAEAKAMRPQANSSRAPKDITTSFTRHASALPAGQLFKDEFFTLFEAVGAIEIMDPKMDSGFIPEGDSFDPEFDVEGVLQPEQVLWVIDQLMCLEIEWLEGYPLSQTVFTSLHVARLLEPGNREERFREGDEHKKGGRNGLDEVLTHEVLRAYCVALIKCLELSMQVIQSQTYYEEEDFVTHLFGRELLPKTTVDDSMVMLIEANQCLEDARALSPALHTALKKRLLLREHMLQALGGSAMHWELMLSLLDDIHTSHNLAVAIPAAFSSKVQRQLATSTPPRPMLNVSWPEAMTKWRQLISYVMEAYHLIAPDMTSDPQCLQRATWTFAYRNPTPTTLPRAIIQEQLFHEQGPIATWIGHYELFIADLRNIVLAGDSLIDPASFQVELPSDPRHIRARLLEGFVEKAFDEYLNIYRMVCQNRCRIRRLLTQAVSIWDALETEAAQVDQAMIDVPISGEVKDTLQRDLRPLSSWAKLHKLRIMTWTVQMGFETEIYMNDELGTMYFLLSRLSTAQSTLIRHIDHHLQARIKRRPIPTSDCLRSSTWLSTTQTLSNITQNLSSALATLFLHLQTLGIIPSPPRDYSQHHLFYEARMKPYLNITNDAIPTALDFDTARRAHARRSTTSVVQDIEADIKRAKALLAEVKKVRPLEGKFVGTEEQFRKEIKGLETTCVAVAVNSSQLGRLAEKFGGEEGALGGKVECVVERRWAEWWVVPVLKEKK